MNFVTIPGSLGAASSESAAGSGRLRAPAAVHAAVESAAVSAVAWSSRGGRAGVSLGSDGCEVRLCDPCARVRPCVPCVRTRIHIHTCVSRLSPPGGVFFVEHPRSVGLVPSHYTRFGASTRAFGGLLYSLRPPRCVSTGPVDVRLAGMANERERARERLEGYL